MDDIACILAAGHALAHDDIDHGAREWEVEERWEEARRFGR